MTILSRVTGKSNKNKLATACHDLNLPMLSHTIKTCSSTFSQMPPTKPFSLSGGHFENLRIYWKYLAGSSCLPPSGPFTEAIVARPKALLSLVFDSHVSAPPVRSTLPVDGRPHEALLWLLSAPGDFWMQQALGDVPVMLFGTWEIGAS